LLEYSALEGRFEIILGVLGLPCNKNLPPEIRKKFQFSHRLQCIKKLFDKKHPITQKSKMTPKDFKGLDNWRNERNRYIHGLAKAADLYNPRLKAVRKMAEDGYEYMRLIYNETSRLKRLAKSHPEMFDSTIICGSSSCEMYVSSDVLPSKTQ